MVHHNFKEMYKQGLPVCRGIAIGKPFFFTFVEDSVPEFFIALDDIDHEIKRYRQALDRSKQDVEVLKKQLEQEKILEGVAILDAHQQMMQDPLLTIEIEKSIRIQRKNAEFIFQNTIKVFQNTFNSMTDPFFRERFKDIQDISRRVMSYLRQSVHFNLADIPEGSIIFAREFSPSDIAEAKKGSASALISEIGGTTSHAAIVAKAKGIPYITNIEFDQTEVDSQLPVIVDGRIGDVIFNPLLQTISHYKNLCEQLHSHIHKLSAGSELKSETYDGYSIKLSANIDMLSEAETLHQYGGNGVGLFRSEHVFLSKGSFPSEEEQFQTYKDIVEKMQGLPIVIRTFDIGGDKVLPHHKFSPETNPYLGCRAIRFLLREHDIFKSQLRAILRASAYGDVSLMFPMVSTLSELLEAKALVEQTRLEIKQEGYLLADKLRIGCMIEVPSAAIISDLLAKECDFLSIGTNDLVQYALAVDRDNKAMSKLYTPTHPSVIRLIKLVVSEANHQGIPVTVCGEVAADPRFTPLLLGLGIRELSVAARYIPIVKHAIRNTSIVAASHLAEQVLRLTTATEIEELLDRKYKQNVPEDCFYNW